jgi:hypothetical protein
VFKNRVLRKILEPKRDKVTGNCCIPHNEKFLDLYSSANIIWVIKSRRMRWAGHMAGMGEKRNLYKVLVARADGKRQLGSPSGRCEDDGNF